MDVRCVCFEFDRKVVWHKKKIKRTCCYLDFPIRLGKINFLGKKFAQKQFLLNCIP